MIIYQTTNLLNGKIYVGQDAKDNPNYYGSGIILERSIKKYGISNAILCLIISIVGCRGGGGGVPAERPESVMSNVDRTR